MTIKNLKKSLSTAREKLVKSLSGGEKGKPHSSKEGREATAKRKFGRMVQAKTSGPKVFGGVKRKPKKSRNF